MPPSSSRQHSFTFRLIVLLGSLSALTALSTDIYLPALSSVGENLNATSLELQLTLGIFLIGYGFGQLFFGPLSDSLGRRPVLLFGIYLYTIASIACALSTHIDFLILNRLLQALGGCATAVTTRAIVRDSSEGIQTTQILSNILAVVQIGPLIAPLIGGAILLFFLWQGTFIALGLFGLILISLSHLWIRESHPIKKRQPLNLTNVVSGYIETLSNRNIALLLSAEIAISLIILSFVTSSSLLLSNYYQLSPQQFGLLFTIIATSLLVGSFFNNLLLNTKDVKWLISAFLSIGTLSAIALLFIALLIPENLVLIIVGIWFCLMPCIALRSNYVSLGLQYIPERSGTVSALFGAFGLGVGGIVAVVISQFDHFTPLILASLILSGFILSSLIYSVWRVQKHHH